MTYKKIMNKIKSIIGEINIMKDISEDQNIESESAKSNYLGIVMDNLRANNKKIARNSFWMLLSVLLYVIIIFDKESISDIGVLFAKINNNLLLVNLVPVFFSFLFLQNMALLHYMMLNYTDLFV